MKTAMIIFTDKGRGLSEKLMEEVSLFGKARVYDSRDMKDKDSLHNFIKKAFAENDAIIFIGAAGMAVRLIAPYIRDKQTDPAVLVVDEEGRFVIPILSGHTGGINEISAKISGAINAIPVITTATDITEKFSVDIYAKENGLEFPDRADIVELSSMVVEGGRVKTKEQPGEDTVYISADEARIKLRRKPYVLGIGCRKGIRQSQLEGYINEILDDYRLSLNDIGLVAAIDLKRDEKGLIEWCEAHKKKLLTFTPAELMIQEGDFTRADSAKQKAGADNVCERVVTAAGCRLFAKKMTKSGISVAIGIRE